MAEVKVTTFDEALEAAREARLPDAALTPIVEAWNKALSLTLENNKRIAQVNASKAQDPNNTDYIDSLWRTHYTESPEMVEVESEYQAAAAEYERLLSKLREFGKTRIPEALSDEQAKQVKAAVSESKDAIEVARSQAASMVSIVDSLLSVHNKGIEGGLISLMPQVESLKNARGRKAGGNSGTSYKTRVNGIDIDGVSTNIGGKGKLDYAANKLSEMWGVATFPENKVTPEAIETALFEHLGKPFRSLRSTELPEKVTEFDFTKDVKTGEGKTETKTVKIAVHRYEAPKAETPKTNEAEAPKVEAPKTNGNEATKTEATKNEAAPAKKIVSAPKK